MKHLLGTSRYLVFLAVAGCFLAAAALFAYGLLAVGRVVWAAIAADININLLSPDEHDVVVIAEHLAIDLIQLADVFLLGTVIYLIGLGLHLLFVNPRLPSSPWMAVADLDDLKEMLVRVIVLLVGVTFLGSFVEQADDVPVQELSTATAVVVISFSVVILVAKVPNLARANGEGRTRSTGEMASPADGE
ncbi:MAG: YqhA family protein [Thermomicrobiales bacterium]